MHVFALLPLSKKVCVSFLTGAAAEDVVEEEEMEDEEELGEEDEMADFIVDEEEVDEHGEPSKYCPLRGTLICMSIFVYIWSVVCIACLVLLQALITLENSVHVCAVSL